MGGTVNVCFNLKFNSRNAALKIVYSGKHAGRIIYFSLHVPTILFVNAIDNIFRSSKDVVKVISELRSVSKENHGNSTFFSQ